MTIPRVLVVGGGPVGLAFACACRGLDVCVVDPAPAAPASPPAGHESRIFALSPGSRSFLRDIGAWEHLDATRMAPVRRMDIFGDAGGKLSFSGRAGTPLAWILEAGRLAHALETQALGSPGVEVLRGVQTQGCGATAAGAYVDLADGRRLEGDVLVAADGADSRVRSLLGIGADERVYEEEAIVANFTTEEPHGDAARQWFASHGVLAWLPLPGRNISIVWSARGEIAGELAALDDRAFERRVRDAGGAALGDLALASPRMRFPLRLISVERVATAGAALIGDAAHTVHPLAGQGANLGLQDARVLSEEILSRSPLERPGDMRVLRRYARARREDVTAMQFVTDRLDALFASGRPFVGDLRNAGLGMVQSQPWIKGLLRDRAMR